VVLTRSGFARLARAFRTPAVRLVLQKVLAARSGFRRVADPAAEPGFWLEYYMAAIFHILIVDDEPQIRDFLSVTFKRAGYAVTTAAGGRAAIALLGDGSFDLMLSDVMMPEMNGHELAQWVAAYRPDVRTALMSGFDATCQGCKFSPRCHLIAKPFHPQQVVAFVGQILAA
jgi:two-component system, cell cycle response regulator CpdR